MDNELALGIKDSLRISAVMFNKTTLCRRQMVIKGLGDFKGARERLKECQPSDEFLFGNDLKELAKAMQEESQFQGKRLLGECFLLPPEEEVRARRQELAGPVQEWQRRLSQRKGSHEAGKGIMYSERHRKIC